MSEMSIAMSLPLDKDGFLRRECPHCERQFKWWPTAPSEDAPEEARNTPEAYFCPYCHEPAPLDADPATCNPRTSDTTLIPPGTQYSATRCKAENRNRLRYAAFATLCTPLQRLNYHS
jgi:hypothetical protein